MRLPSFTTHKLVSTVGTDRQDQWHHPVGSFDEGSQRLYFDGQEANSVLSPQPVLEAEPFGNGFFLAKEATKTFIGDLDEATVFDRALSATEVMKLHNAGGSLVCFQRRAHRIESPFICVDWRMS